MNPFIFSFVALCLTQGAIAQYQSGGSSYGQQQQQQMNSYQRKMSPAPQAYGLQSASYQAEPQQHQQQHQQQQQQQSYETSSYEQPQQQYAQRAPSSASVASYDERTPTAGYAKSAAPSYNQRQSSSYGPAAQASYSAPQSYAKPAPKYEEPVHPPMPFAWGYDINDGYGGAQYHKESGDEYGKRTGSYGYTDAYGIYRQVDYVADEHGFRATIKTNEPGTANESPADVELHAYEPPSNYYAGNTNNNYNSYGAGKQSAYAAPVRPSYGAAAAATSSYGQGQRQSASAYKAPAGYSRQASSYEPAAQYSSSAIVPVYQKASSSSSSAKKY